jgi:hypothetical protein
VVTVAVASLAAVALWRWKWGSIAVVGAGVCLVAWTVGAA